MKSKPQKSAPRKTRRKASSNAKSKRVVKMPDDDDLWFAAIQTKAMRDWGSSEDDEAFNDL
jgi:hypothetical protein